MVLKELVLFIHQWLQQQKQRNHKQSNMVTILIIYIVGFIIAFTINAVMNIQNVKEANILDIDLSDKVIVTSMSIVGAIFSWLFIIVFILSLRNGYVANKLKNIFSKYSTSEL